MAQSLETESTPHPSRHPRIRVGMPQPPGGQTPTVQAFLDHAQWAERRGFYGLSLPDTGGIDALTVAAALAHVTKRIVINTSVVPVYPRTPAVFASTLYTLHQLSGGRFTLGWGVSSHAMIEGWHGLTFQKPRSTIREATLLLREMLSGAKTAFEGELQRSHGYRLPGGEACNVPIYLAALRSRMLETAGEVGDGVIINRFPIPFIPTLLKHIAIGVARAGKSPDSLDIVANMKFVVTERPDAALEKIRNRFAGYYATPVYNKYLAWCGFPEQAAALAEGWRSRDRAKTLGVMDDDLLRQFVVAGSADECRATARGVLAAGVNSLTIDAFTSDPDLQRATYDAFAPDNFSLDDPAGG